MSVFSKISLSLICRCQITDLRGTLQNTHTIHAGNRRTIRPDLLSPIQRIDTPTTPFQILLNVETGPSRPSKVGTGSTSSPTWVTHDFDFGLSVDGGTGDGIDVTIKESVGGEIRGGELSTGVLVVVVGSRSRGGAWRTVGETETAAFVVVLVTICE